MDKDLVALTENQITERLKTIPGWSYGNNKIFRQFEFESFNSGLEFVNDLAPFFNKIDHHPDIHIYYKKILFELTRFSIRGKVTERDFTVAKKISEKFSKET